MSIYYPPTQNSIQKTLDAQLLSGVTASMTLNNVVGIANKPGVCVVDFVDTNNVETPTKREYIAFTGVSGNTLTGLTRNADGGGSDQDHVVGAIVQFPPDILQQKAIIDTILVQHGDDGVHSSALVTTLKASGAEINTGTEDAKIVTPKAIADSKLVDYIRGDGWISANETWTYASATTITVPSGAASKYARGDKIKLTQTTVKYFYIIGVEDTVLTVDGKNIYTLADAPITNNYYSHSLSPIGFPPYWGFLSAETTNNLAAVFIGVVNKLVAQSTSVNFLSIFVDTYHSCWVDFEVSSTIIQGVGPGGYKGGFAVTNTGATNKFAYQLGSAVITVTPSTSAGTTTFALSHNGNSSSILVLRYKITSIASSPPKEL